MNAQCREVELTSALIDGESNRKRTRRRRRESPRRSGMDAWGIGKAQQQKSRFRSLGEEELRGPPSRTRASLKRKLQEPSSTRHQGKNKLKEEDQSSSVDENGVMKPQESSRSDVWAPDSDQQLVASSTQPLPPKQTLELIIDTLQRRDTYEIFAEPVDPDEVEDYYEIIKEPMDFGTMRAKLHEGMYTSLEQFEHDVFLIPGNAMHFNSSSTIFFRQARAIHELAKKVFHLLRTDPERFESEFSGTRRRSCRRSVGEAKDLSSKSLPKSCTIGRKNSPSTIDASLNSSSPSLFRSSPGNPFAAKTTRQNFRGMQGDRRCFSMLGDRRSTYRPHLDLDNENNSKLLIPLNQQELTYRESLMRFVKDLGPTAQMIAKHKLHASTSRQTISPDYSQQPAFTFPDPFGQTRPSDLSRNLFNPSPKPSSKVIDLTNAEEREKSQGIKTQRNGIWLDPTFSILNNGKPDSSTIGFCKMGCTSTDNECTTNDGLEDSSVIGFRKTSTSSTKVNIGMRLESLYANLDDEKDSSVVGIIKRGSTDTKNVMTRIRLDSSYPTAKDGIQDSSFVRIIKTSNTPTEKYPIRLDCYYNSTEKDQEDTSSVVGFLKTGSGIQPRSSYSSSCQNRDQESLVSGFSKTISTNQASDKSNGTHDHLKESSTKRELFINKTSILSLPCVTNYSSRFAFDLGFLKSKMHGKMNIMTERGGGGGGEFEMKKGLSFTQQLDEETTSAAWPSITNTNSNQPAVSSSSLLDYTDHLSLQL